MAEIQAEQATAVMANEGQLRWLAQSPGFLEAWKELLTSRSLAQCARPESAHGVVALLLLNVAPKLVAIGRVAEIADAAVGVIRFHWLVLAEDLYRGLGGDPFLLADACPPSWEARGTLTPATLPWPIKSRTVEDVCAVLQRDDGPMLLGAAQALVDGGRLAWVRPQPANDLLRAVWTLLPTSTRAELRPATFALDDFQSFDAVVVPHIVRGDFDRRYLSEEQASNYPEGRYELAVQRSAEANDQPGLDHLFARRSRRETWRLGLWLAGSLAALVLLTSLFKALAGG